MFNQKGPNLTGLPTGLADKNSYKIQQINSTSQ
jgi:hypothetical protein